MSHKALPGNSPIVNVSFLANVLGITPGAVRRYLPPDGWQPLLPTPIFGLGEYAWLRAEAESWLAAYRAAPKRGRRGDGSVRRKHRRIKDATAGG